MENEKEFKDITTRISVLKNTRPDEEFVSRLHSRFAQQIHQGFLFLPLVRFVSIVAIFLLAGTGIVVASRDSREGELLYPLKTLVESLVPQTEDSKDKQPSESSEVSPTPTPTRESREMIPQTNQVSPTQVPVQPTATPKPVFQIQSVVITPTPQAQVEVQVLGGTVELQLGNPDPTPTKQPLIDLPVSVDVGLGEKKILNVGL